MPEWLQGAVLFLALLFGVGYVVVEVLPKMLRAPLGSIVPTLAYAAALGVGIWLYDRWNGRR